MRLYAHIRGWGKYVPPHVMTNDDIARRVDTDDEWIRARTGIAERRIAGKDDTTTTMAHKAALKALQVADANPAAVELIIVATMTPDRTMPSTASHVQDLIGAERCAAFDLNAACSGFVYAFSVASQLISSGAYRNALVIGSEAMSHILDWTDRSTCILFGDGAGAVVLDAGDGESGFVDHILGADGRGAPLGRAGQPGDENKLYQNGREVFKFAVRILPDMFEKLLSRNDLTSDDVQYVIPHQANARIINAAAKRMALPGDRIVVNLDRFGNTSAASIPLSYPDIFDEMERGKYIVTVGFGFGLTWAANLYRI